MHCETRSKTRLERAEHICCYRLEQKFSTEISSRPSAVGIRLSVTMLKSWPHDRLAPENLRSPPLRQHFWGRRSLNLITSQAS
jgi:hypothetical protein